MSFLKGNDALRLNESRETTSDELLKLTREIQINLDTFTVSAELLEAVKNYLNKIDSFLPPKPRVKDPAAAEFLWPESIVEKFVTIYKTLGNISDHPLGEYECGEEEIVGVKALRIMVSLTLLVPGLLERIKKSNESASNLQS